MLTQAELRILRTYKEGGQKKVYLVDIESRGLSSVIYKTGQAPSPTDLRRIIREVEIQRTIESSYFPINYHLEYNDRGEFEILEEYIPAPQLRECMGDFDSENKIGNFAIEILTACSELWNKRVVHRDLKPENILVRDNSPVILDLGIARALDEAPLTSSRLAAGPCTRNYAAPEQLVNLRQHIGFRTDLYVIGILIAELFLQMHPFHPDIVGSGMSVADNILKNIYVLDFDDRTMSPQLRSVVIKLLQPMPYNRYRNAELCIQELGG